MCPVCSWQFLLSVYAIAYGSIQFFHAQRGNAGLSRLPGDEVLRRGHQQHKALLTVPAAVAPGVALLHGNVLHLSHHHGGDARAAEVLSAVEGALQGEESLLY